MAEAGNLPWKGHAMECPSCGATNSETARFCSLCFGKLGEQPAAEPTAQGPLPGANPGPVTSLTDAEALFGTLDEGLHLVGEQPDRAIELLRSVLAHRDALSEAGVTTVYAGLVRAHRELGQWREMLDVTDGWLELVGPVSLGRIEPLGFRGDALAKLGDLPAAFACKQEVVVCAGQYFGQASIGEARQRCSFVWWCADHGYVDEADAELALADRVYAQVLGTDGPGYAPVLLARADIQTARQLYDDANATYARALKVLTEAPALELDRIAQAYVRYAISLEKQGRSEDANRAIACSHEAIEARQRQIAEEMAKEAAVQQVFGGRRGT